MIKLGNPKRIVMAGLTLGCALGIGYFMQLSGHDRGAAQANETTAPDAPREADAMAAAALTPAADTAPDRDAGTLPVAEVQQAGFGLGFETGGEDEIRQVVLTSAAGAPVPPMTAPQPEALPAAPLRLAALEDAPIRSFPKEEAAPVLTCEGEIAMTARPADAAMVTLELTAPCEADRQFVLHHSGMMFSALTDSDGAWSMQVPALTRNAVFIAAFDSGEGAVANAEVDTLDRYDRYVLQWQGQSGMQIHALEYGADYGEAGHVWADAARDAGSAMSGDGGFLVRLGDGVIEDATLMAEVYTFPTGAALRDGRVQVHLEAEISAANCGRDIEAQALIRPGTGDMAARDLSMAIPDCDAVGDFLVLKNLYEDLKIARN